MKRFWASAKPIRCLSCARALGYPALRFATATQRKFCVSPPDGRLLTIPLAFFKGIESGECLPTATFVKVGRVESGKRKAESGKRKAE